MIRKIIKIALNNVFKQKRRSLLNALTFAANMFALVALLGMITGQYNLMFEKSIDLSSGHFKIYNSAYVGEKRRMPLDLTIKDPGAVIAAISKAPHFVAADARITKDCILSNTKRKTGVVLNGVNFEKGKKISSVFNKVTGNPPQKGSSGLLVGKRLAELLKIKEGDPLLVYGQTKQKANNLVDSTATGFYSAGFPFMEKMVVYADYGFVSDFLDMGGEATEIIVRLDSRDNVAEAKKYIRNVVDKEFPGLVVRDWMEEQPSLIAAAKMDFISYGIIFGILLFLAVFIIINTLTISVFERTAEIGTMRAIGLSKGQVRAIFFIEGMTLSGLGVILGGLLVLPLVYYLNVHGISIKEMGVGDLNVPFEPVMKAMNHFSDWLIAGTVCMIAGAIGAVYPSNKAAETNIVEALKRGVR